MFYPSLVVRLEIGKSEYEWTSDQCFWKQKKKKQDEKEIHAFYFMYIHSGWKKGKRKDFLRLTFCTHDFQDQFFTIWLPAQ